MFNWNIKENPIRSIFGMGGGATSLAVARVIGASLYPFSSFTFTPGGKDGRDSQPLSDFLADPSYDTTSNPWLNNTIYFSMPQDGFQLWTVPQDAEYTIAVTGASGGSISRPGSPNTNFYAEGGGGATISANFSLTSGTKILIITGQHGTPHYRSAWGAAGGGGGTFVLKENASTNDDIYIIAGGGAGSSYYPGRMPTGNMNGPNSPGNTTSGGDAQPPYTIPSSYGSVAPGPDGGSYAQGGTNGYGGGGSVGGGGGGFFGPGGGGPPGIGVGSPYGPHRNGHGYTTSPPITPAPYRLFGGHVVGPQPSPSGWSYDTDQGSGGFGGGGASQPATGYGGGAGGYSGGGGGSWNGSVQQTGGYGGSYVHPSATNVTRTAGTNIPSTSQGINGQVVITKN